MKIIRTGLGDTGQGKGKQEGLIRGEEKIEDWIREGKDDYRTR
jgi:hypothetical protein